MTPHKPLGDFAQPSDVRTSFLDFTTRQTGSSNPERVPIAIIELGYTRGVPSSPMHQVVYPLDVYTLRAWYRQCNGRNELDLRTSQPDNPTTIDLTTYYIDPDLDLLVAYEGGVGSKPANASDRPGSPQALALALGVEPFARGGLTRRSGSDDSEWSLDPYAGIVGSREWAVLTTVLVGHSL
jgi:hypothetical protein